MSEETELKWHGRNKLVDTHKEERIINGVKVIVTVCKPAEANGSDYPLNWKSRIALEVEEANLDEEEVSTIL